MSIDQEPLRVSAECDRLIAERDALAARVQEMRGLLEDSCRPEPPTKDTGCCISCGSWTPHGNPERHAHEDDCEAWKTYIAIRARTPSLAKKAIITPDTSAQILARRDAAIWMEAADLIKAKGVRPHYLDYVQALRAKADELLKGLEKAP